MRPKTKSTGLTFTQSHVSRRDLFLKSLANRAKSKTNEEPEPEEEESPKDIEPNNRICDWSPITTTDDESDSRSSTRPIPTRHEKIKFHKSLQSAASMVFHSSGLPLTSSPAPLRRGQVRFDFDSSLVSPAHINTAVKKSHFPR